MTEPHAGTPSRGAGAGNFDRDRAISRVHKAIAEHVSLENVSQEIMTIVREEFGLDRAAIILESDLGIHAFSQPLAESIREDAVSLVQSAGQVLCVYDVMEEGPERNLMHKHGFSIGTPLMLKKLNLAALLLGGKHSGEPFGIEEIECIDDIAVEVSMAIENSESYFRLKTLISELEKWDNELLDELSVIRQFEQEKNERLADLKDRFYIIAADEIRTPIRTLRELLDASQESDLERKKYQMQNLIAVIQACEHLDAVVSDLLETAHLDMPQGIPQETSREFTPTLEHALEEMVHSLRRRFSQKS